MLCPNCNRELGDDALDFTGDPFSESGHGDDCMLLALLRVIRDREDHDLTGLRLEPVDINAMWDRVGPVVDALEDELGLKRAPDTLTIRRVK